jgi:hypothetical protein
MFDASLLAGVPYTQLASGVLVSDFGAHGFEQTNRPPPLHDGLGAAFWDDGLLRHVGRYVAGACIASLDLHPPSEQGVFAQGKKMRTGEVYHRGTIEVLSPWSDNDVAQPTEQTFASWVAERLAAVLAAT